MIQLGTLLHMEHDQQFTLQPLGLAIVGSSTEGGGHELVGGDSMIAREAVVVGGEIGGTGRTCAFRPAITAAIAFGDGGGELGRGRTGRGTNLRTNNRLLSRALSQRATKSAIQIGA